MDLENGFQPEYVTITGRKKVLTELKDAAKQAAMEFVNISKAVLNTIHANNEAFYEELDHVIQKEPVSLVDPELLGLAAAIGIEKGKPFEPDARMKKILTQAAKLGNATVRALFWHERDQSEFLYEGSYWKVGFPGGNYEFLREDGKGGRDRRGVERCRSTQLGRIEFFGWNFFDPISWSNTEFNEGRIDFELGTGVVAVADSDAYDDAFVAYLNGVEIARSNVTGAPSWDSTNCFSWTRINPLCKSLPMK